MVQTSHNAIGEAFCGEDFWTFKNHNWEYLGAALGILLRGIHSGAQGTTQTQGLNLGFPNVLILFSSVKSFRREK